MEKRMTNRVATVPLTLRVSSARVISMSRKLRVLFAASEAYPLIKTGGLADVAGHLPLALQALDVEVIVALPAYARVLEQVESEHGLRPVIIGGPSPVERRIADQVLSATGANVVDALGDDLRKLVWILDGSALLISPDTGPLHISRALGTPVVGLYGYTNPKRSGPYGAFEDLIVDGYAEYPGEQYPVTSTYRDGMERITVDGVLQKVSLAMQRYVKR